MFGGNADFAVIPGLTDQLQARGHHFLENRDQVEILLDFLQNGVGAGFVVGNQGAEEHFGVVARRARGFELGRFGDNILNRLRPKTARAGVLELPRHLADAHAGIQFALYPEQQLNVPLGVEAVAVRHTHRRKQVVAPFPRSQCDGFNAGTGLHNLYRVCGFIRVGSDGWHNALISLYTNCTRCSVKQQVQKI